MPVRVAVADFRCVGVFSVVLVKVTSMDSGIVSVVVRISVTDGFDVDWETENEAESSYDAVSLEVMNSDAVVLSDTDSSPDVEREGVTPLRVSENVSLPLVVVEKTVAVFTRLPR